ncbi:MAG: choice-of-anchor Q domain-containing protein [Myxococcaceae bacterium]
MRLRSLIGGIGLVALISGCSCDVVPAEDDAGVGGGSVGGGSVGGGSVGGGSVGGGSVAGGSVAGGSVAGGSVAGGSVAGGSVTGGGNAAGGNAAGGTAQTDVYVCANCPGANANNPGTANRPVDSIVRGLQLAQMNNLPRVLVAARFGANVASYAEDITMVEGRSLDGRWSVTGAAGNLSWSRNGPRTQLRNTAPAGLKFPAGLSAGTTLDGFAIEKSGPGLGAGRVVGITITSSAPVLRDFSVDVPQIAIGTANDAIGVDVVGAPAAMAAPSFQGGAGVQSVVNAGQGQASSLALSVTFGRVTVTNVDFAAANANTTSAGVFLTSSSGSTFNRGTYSAGAASSCFGFASSGDASGVRVEGVTATGCPRTPNLLNPSRIGIGVLFDNCPPLTPGGATPLVRNVTATGGVVGGNGSTAIGGASADGCAVRFEGAPAGASTFTGATGAPSIGQGPENGFGIACSFAGIRSMNGFDARCSVSGVTATGGLVGSANSAGLVCDGTCGNQPVSCRGSCEEVVNNTFLAGPAGAMSHVFIRNSSPALRQNLLGVARNGVTCGNNATVAGLSLEGSASNVVNNLIVAGPCLTSVGVAHTLRLRSDGMTPSPTFHSNTIVSTPSGSGGNPTLTSVGVQLGAPMGSAALLQGGVWRNNIIFAGPSQGGGAVSIAFRETTPGTDPLTLANNLFFTQGTMSLYVDEGSTTLGTQMAINGLTGASGNLAANPQFMNAGNANFSLQNSSPARGAGGTVGAPPVDVTGAPRPVPVGSNPDLGCYEVN